MNHYIFFFYFLLVKLSLADDLSTANISLIVNLKIHFDVPTILNLDPKITNKINGYTTRLMMETEKIYSKPEMSLPISFNLLGESSQIDITTDLHYSSEDSPKTLLEKYCAFQEKEKSKDNLWFSLLVTGVDLYRVAQNPGDKRQKIFGISKPGSHCDISRSCIVAHFDLYPSNVASVFAHELGHSFGLIHHTEPECAGDDIMDADQNKRRFPNSWCKISRDELDTFLSNPDLSSCLGNDTFRSELSRKYLPLPDN